MTSRLPEDQKAAGVLLHSPLVTAFGLVLLLAC
jgi:hypothetical protein